MATFIGIFEKNNEPKTDWAQKIQYYMLNWLMKFGIKLIYIDDAIIIQCVCKGIPFARQIHVHHSSVCYSNKNQSKIDLTLRRLLSRRNRIFLHIQLHIGSQMLYDGFCCTRWPLFSFYFVKTTMKPVSIIRALPRLFANSRFLNWELPLLGLQIIWWNFRFQNEQNVEQRITDFFFQMSHLLLLNRKTCM